MKLSLPARQYTGLIAAGALAAFLIMAVFIGILNALVDQKPMGAERADLRRQYLAELRKSDEEVTNNYAWQDQSKGIVRVPIDRAIEIATREWQDAENGRRLLWLRAEKALGHPPQPEPQPEADELEFE